MKSCAELVKPGGLLFTATINRTPRAYALAIVGAEYVLGWLPRGTHDFSKFLTPDEISTLVKRNEAERDRQDRGGVPPAGRRVAAQPRPRRQLHGAGRKASRLGRRHQPTTSVLSA